MTAENHGTGAPSEGGDEDPFAYLYRQEGGAQQPAASGQQPGVPRRSFNQVRAVGERQYGYGYPQQQQRSAYGYPQQQSASYQHSGAPQQQSGYGYPQQPPPPGHQPSPHYAAPETMPGGRAAARQQGAPGGPGRGRRNRTGLLVGAIAVVAAVVIGIGAAIVFNEDDTDDPQAKDSGSAQQDDPKQGNDDGTDGEKNDKPSPKALPKEDAASLTLDGSATAAKDVQGAKGRGGTYVGGMNQPGASATWELKDVPTAGKYTLHVRYGVPGKDADATLTVNGEPESRPLRMKNFSGAKKGDWEHGWQNTWSNIQLKKGQNSIKISCEEGNKCDANLDQVWLEKGWNQG
ncbi:carbohydrate-binding protein [Streptomyces reniochalinae]|uniref:CBM6 domain-containing protein n=1 Tax=Streptomyces reniochalinae TaxID=2250578 RepID=A0A367EKZ5_9ACTN|nr:hypothetical protein [Streptomyces reniochalinae]RCG18057.1 hypothetical protein DQ392_15425 [Streptomyces reniochalinae]